MPSAVVYAAEKLPTNKIKSMLDTYWDTRTGGEIPEPQFLEVVTDEPAYNLTNDGDTIVIRPDTRGETERLRDSWNYKDTEYVITLELHTAASRQRLYDLKAEVRRLCHVYKHNKTVTGYQVLIYESFVEYSDIENQIWEGEIKLRLQTVGEVLDI